MMAYSEDHVALAAEYALGTLDAAERAQVETMMAVDKDFMVLVQSWEYRLGVLNQMVGSVEPRPEVWDRIRSAAGLSGPQAPLVPPDAPPPAAPKAAAPGAAADNANVVGLSTEAMSAQVLSSQVLSSQALSSQVQRWRNVATLTTAIAAALVAMIAVGAYQPDWLPDGLRPKPRTQVVEVKTAPVPAPPFAQYVAVLQKEGGAPAFILTVAGATRNLTVRKVGASAEPGKSFELWLISDRLPGPRSLGVIGDGDFSTLPVLASYDPDIVNNATYAVTLEQAGGSPDGNPHSAPVYAGKLVETVPPTAPVPSPPR
jgi:anti-sigma-K factor RskA